MFFPIIKKNFKFIAIFTLAVILAVLFYCWRISGGYNVSLPLLISVKTSQSSADFQYGGYYNIEAADDFGDTVVQWAKSAEIANIVYAKSGIGPSTKFLGVSYYKFNAQKMAPQYVEIKFQATNPQSGEKVAQALVAALKEKADLASQISGNIVFDVSGSQAISSKNQVNFILYGFLALIGGFLLAVFFVLLKLDN